MSEPNLRSFEYPNNGGQHGFPRLLGVPVITSRYLTISTTVEVERTWRERLFSWPWRPWRSTRTVTIYKPDPLIYETERGLVMHPAILEELRKRVKP